MTIMTFIRCAQTNTNAWSLFSLSVNLIPVPDVHQTMIMKVSMKTWMLPSKRIIGLRESLISKGDNKGNRTCSRPSGWTLLSQQGCIGSDLTPMDFDTGKFLRVLHFSMMFIEPYVLCWGLMYICIQFHALDIDSMKNSFKLLSCILLCLILV